MLYFNSYMQLSIRYKELFLKQFHRFHWCCLIERSDSNFDNNELDREIICKDSNFMLLVTNCH